MITADIHGITTARHTYYNRRQDDQHPEVVIGPWATVELFDADGNSVAMFIRTEAEADLLRDAGAVAGHLLASAGQAEAAALVDGATP